MGAQQHVLENGASAYGNGHAAQPFPARPAPALMPPPPGRQGSQHLAIMPSASTSPREFLEAIITRIATTDKEGYFIVGGWEV